MRKDGDIVRCLAVSSCLAFSSVIATPTSAAAGSHALRGVEEVGRVVITVASDTVAAADVREVVEQHLLDDAVATVDGSPASLVLTVEVDRYPSEDERCSYAAYWVTLELREPAALRRDPDRAVNITSWRTGTRLYGRSATVPTAGIFSMVETVMRRFDEGVQ